MTVRREEIREAVLWCAGSLLVVTLTGYGIYRGGRYVVRRLAGAR